VGSGDPKIYGGTKQVWTVAWKGSFAYGSSDIVTIR